MSVFSRGKVGSIIVVCLTVVLLPACSSIEPTAKDANSSVEQTLQILKREFVRGNTLRFMRFVDEGYDDGLNNRGDLRFDVDRVFDQYSNVDLTFYGLRTTRSDGAYNVRASWNLRWTCSRTGRGCSTVGETILRRGLTTLQFLKDGDQFRLVSQTGDRVFGSMTPGDVRR